VFLDEIFCSIFRTFRDNSLIIVATFNFERNVRARVWWNTHTYILRSDIWNIETYGQYTTLKQFRNWRFTVVYLSGGETWLFVIGLEIEGSYEKIIIYIVKRYIIYDDNNACASFGHVILFCRIDPFSNSPWATTATIMIYIYILYAEWNIAIRRLPANLLGSPYVTIKPRTHHCSNTRSCQKYSVERC